VFKFLSILLETEHAPSLQHRDIQQRRHGMTSLQHRDIQQRRHGMTSLQHRDIQLTNC